MKRTELTVIIALLFFGLVYQFIDSGKIQNLIGIPKKYNLESKKITAEFNRKSFIQKKCSKLMVSNPAGNITVRQSQNSDIQIKPSVRIYNTSKRKAEDINKNTNFEFVVLRKQDLARFDVKNAGDFPYRNLRIDMEVTVPADVKLKINCRYGHIDLSGLNNPVQIDQVYGNLKAGKIGHSITAVHRHGEIDLKNFTEPIDIDSAFSKIHLRNCSGFSIKGFHSSIDIADINGPGYIANSYQDIRIWDMRGDLNIQAKSCPISIDRIIGQNLLIKNRYKNVQMRNIQTENLDLLLSKGNLVLGFIEISESLSIKSTHSSMELNLPRQAKPMFNIQLKYGKIQNRTPRLLEIRKTSYTQKATSSSGLPIIVIDGKYGDLNLNQER